MLRGVLGERDAAEMKAFCCTLKEDPDLLPDKDCSSMGGPLEKRVDHPHVAGFMNEFLAKSYSAATE